MRHQPKCLVLFEQSEFALYAIERELQQINLVEPERVRSPIVGQCGAPPPL
ncbi:hypothetical protein [Marinobacter sp. LV10R510-11A]|uniref:hypothetical protein n=1 Tax=Marinobacter sp. LV10R510-11A TaxID=1415568 RepID=UPI0039B6F06A